MDGATRKHFFEVASYCLLAKSCGQGVTTTASMLALAGCDPELASLFMYPERAAREYLRENSPSLADVEAEALAASPEYSERERLAAQARENAKAKGDTSPEAVAAESALLLAEYHDALRLAKAEAEAQAEYDASPEGEQEREYNRFVAKCMGRETGSAVAAPARRKGPLVELTPTVKPEAKAEVNVEPEPEPTSLLAKQKADASKALAAFKKLIGR